MQVDSNLVASYFCDNCFWNKENFYSELKAIVEKHKEDTMPAELKFPEAKDYPDGFNWFAYDENGEGYFYTKKPYFLSHQKGWIVDGEYIQSKVCTVSYTVSNWKETVREKPTTQANAINPNYYKWHPVCEAVKITQEFTTNLGCVINYIWRVASPDARKYDSKEGRIQDLQKAIRHLEFEIERIKAEC